MKIKSVIAIATMLTLTACGPSYRVTDEPSVSTTSRWQVSFSKQYPTANNSVWTMYDADALPIDWELAQWTYPTKDAYMVRFNMENQDYYSWYDSNGEWIGTTYVVSDYNTLPEAVNNTLRSEFPGYTITSAHKEYKKDQLAYEVELKNGDSKVKLLLNGYGTIIRQKTK